MPRSKTDGRLAAASPGRHVLRIEYTGKINNTLALDIAPPARLAYADQRAVKQILVNLLSNGVKYTPSGGEVRLMARIDRGIEITVREPDRAQEVALAIAQVTKPHAREIIGAAPGKPTKPGKGG